MGILKILGIGAAPWKRSYEHVTAYHEFVRYTTGRMTHSFIFVAGHPKIHGLPEEFYGHTRILTRKLPERIGKEKIAKGGKAFAVHLIRIRPEHNGRIRIVKGDYGRYNSVMGEIIYEEGANGCWMTSAYSPKAWVRGAAKRLGYFLEILATEHLKSLGVTHISTSSAPELPRIKQLEAAGLPIKIRMPIGEWIAGLKRGLNRPVSKNPT